MTPGLNGEHTPENCFTAFQTSHPFPLASRPANPI